MKKTTRLFLSLFLFIFLISISEAQVITGETSAPKDTPTESKGFINGASEAQEYLYDANGNLIEDKNKKAHIEYNHLNLVKRVVMDGVEVRYDYTAAGTKVSKTVIRGNETTVYDYINGFEYKNNQLQFFAIEEGRVVPGGKGGYTCEYFLKDHLGNIRVTFTSERESIGEVATMESEEASTESSRFINYTEAVKVNAAIFDHTGKGPTYNSTRLNGTSKERIGLAKTLSVMPGDTIRLEVFAKYLDPKSSNWTTALSDLITSIAKGTAPAGTFIDGGGELGGTGGVNFPFAGLLDKSRETGDAPKAYLNYLVFDRHYNRIDGGYVPVTDAARESGQDGDHERLTEELRINEPGFVITYLSNDNVAMGGESVEVYFDDFSVVQEMGPIVETEDYYPYGLTFNSYSRENATPNLFQFGGKEVQKELGEGSYDFGARVHDALTGRWSVIDPLAEKYASFSPYNYALNNPVKYIDPDGMGPHFSLGGEGLFGGNESGDWVHINSIFSFFSVEEVNREANNLKPTEEQKEAAKVLGHVGLDAGGAVPGVGTPINIFHAGWYAYEEDYVNAGLCMAAAVPLEGTIATAGKYGSRLIKAIGTTSRFAARSDKEIHWAFGFTKFLPRFSKKVNAVWWGTANSIQEFFTYRYQGFVHFNLSGLDDVAKAFNRGKSGLAGSTETELYEMIEKYAPQYNSLERTTFYVEEAWLNTQKNGAEWYKNTTEFLGKYGKELVILK